MDLFRVPPFNARDRSDFRILATKSVAASNDHSSLLSVGGSLLSLAEKTEIKPQVALGKSPFPKDGR
jgi:hypothetical protein